MNTEENSIRLLRMIMASNNLFQNNVKLAVGITSPKSIVLIKGQLKYFSNQGYTVYLIAPKNDATITFCDQENAILVPLDISRNINIIKDIVSLFNIFRIFIKLKPDIVNLGTPKISFLGMIAAKTCRIRKKIYTCRGFRFEHEKGIKKKMLIAAERCTVNNSDLVIVISKSVLQFGINKGILNKNKSVVLGSGSSNGIDFNLFNPDNVSENVRNELINRYGLIDKFVFGYIGRIIKRKGFNELIEAFTGLYKYDKSIRLLVVGDPEANQLDKISLEVARNHPGIIMIGSKQFDEIPIYLSLMHILVHPAYWEGFGNVLIQASAMGIPVISTKVSGCLDAVNDGFNGDLVEAKNSIALRMTMEKLKSDKMKRIQYGKNGIIWSRNFQSKDLWELMDSLYRN